MLAHSTFLAVLATVCGLVVLRDENIVHNTSAATCSKHTLSPLQEGGYIVAWLENGGVETEVKAKRYDNGGVEVDATPITLVSGTSPQTLCVRGTQSNFIGIVTTNSSDMTSMIITSSGTLGDNPKVEYHSIGALGIADPACSAVFGPSSLSVLYPESPTGLSAFIKVTFFGFEVSDVDDGTLYQSLATERNDPSNSYVLAYSSTGGGLIIRKQSVVEPGDPETMDLGSLSGDVRLATLADAGTEMRVVALVNEGVAHAKILPTLTSFELLDSDTNATNPTVACMTDTTCLYSFELATGDLVGLFDVAGIGLTERMDIATTGTTGIELGPKSILLNDDDMLVVWNHAGDGNSCDIRSRVVNYVPPTSAPPTDAPPTSSPPTVAPPTDAPPSNSPPTPTPPTIAPTSAPATLVPTPAPPTPAPETNTPSDAPPTQAPQTQAPQTSTPSNAPSSDAPTTLTPTRAPPTDAPSTTTPTNAPSTMTPTNAPPTDAPPTVTPTNAPPTLTPTNAPPTDTPPTLVPTIAPLGDGLDDDDQMSNVGRGLITAAAATVLILAGVGFFVWSSCSSPVLNEPSAA